MDSSTNFKLKKCGVRFEPPAVIVYYEQTDKNKLHKRIMPVRSFKKTASVHRVAEELKERHSKILSEMPTIRLEKLLRIIQEQMKGRTLVDALQDVNKEFAINSEENLNKLDDDVLKRKKELMDDSFKISHKKPGDDDYQYDVEVNFDHATIEGSEWDSDHDKSEF